MIFLSTLSLRRATQGQNHDIRGRAISIHALLAESDVFPGDNNDDLTISIHALLAESDPAISCVLRGQRDFYPRSPCGERPHAAGDQHGGLCISIHALLAESDDVIAVMTEAQSISIHALLAESDQVLHLSRFIPPGFLSTLSLRRATIHIP